RKPPQGREAAHRPLQRAVRVLQPRPGDRDARVCVEIRRELLDAVADDPGIRVEEERIRPLRRPHAGVVAAAHAAVLLLDHARLREALAHELERPVGRAVVDDDHLVTAHRVEAALDPGHRVVGDDDDRDVSGHASGTVAGSRRRVPSHRMITRPGTPSASVITKKMKPVAKAASASTSSLPRKLTKNASRTPRPLTVNGTSMTRKRSGPRTTNGSSERWMSTAFAEAQIATMRISCAVIVRRQTTSSVPGWSR